jgi:hypothetical protein
MLWFHNGDRFARGACRFERTIPTESGALPRIALVVEVEGIRTEAALDTGGAYLYCNSQLRAVLDLDPADAVGTNRLSIRGRTSPGHLHRVSLQLLASSGESLLLEVTAFVPREDPSPLFDVPVYLGFMGCMERCRFAVDPDDSVFYFGYGEEQSL